jgi:predicted metal-dependent RNase
MYKKLLEENIPEDVDISNNNFTPKPGELVVKDRCLL